MHIAVEILKDELDIVQTAALSRSYEKAKVLNSSKNHQFGRFLQ